MSRTGFSYPEWHRRRARAAFHEPKWRFFDVAYVGVLGTLVLFMASTPGGLLYNIVFGLWDAHPADIVLVSSGITQVSLTVWALVVSIGGVAYIEASRKTRTDARHAVDAIHAGRTYLRARGFSRRLPADLTGTLVTLANDTPALNPLTLTSTNTLTRLAVNYAKFADYWTLQAGYQVAPRDTVAAPEAARAIGQDRAIVLWRWAGAICFVLGLALYVRLGGQTLLSLLAPFALVVSVVLFWRARNVLLLRGAKE